MVVAVLPYGTTVEEIGATPELVPGIVSAGLGGVPFTQTLLDISQGNRVNEALYDGELPPLRIDDGRVPPSAWKRVVARAEAAPADVIPGLLASSLMAAGVDVTAEDAVGLPALIGVDREGEIAVADVGSCSPSCGSGLSLIDASAEELPQIVAGLDLEGGDVLIALAAGARGEQQLLPIGIAGEGFDGDLTSSSTRTDGLVTTSDLAPTILEAFGVRVPDEVNGSEITSGDQRDPAEVADLQDRLDERPSRDTVVLLPFAIWLLAAALASLAWRGRGARVALRLLGLAVASGPLLLLLAAAFDAGAATSALLFGVGSLAVASIVGRLVPGFGAFALAGGATVTAYAVDVVVGSPLTAYSVLGPNPGYGVRFFGIGNELEAILTPLALIATGAGLAATGRTGRTAAVWFAGVALLAAAAFAPGRFGADVGAAIVLGVGGASRRCSLARPRSPPRGSARRRRRSRRARRPARGRPAARWRAPEPHRARRRRGERPHRRPRAQGRPDARHFHRPGLPGAAGHRGGAPDRRIRAPRSGPRLVRRRSCAGAASSGPWRASSSAPSPTIPAPCCSFWARSAWRRAPDSSGRPRRRKPHENPPTGANRTRLRDARG